MKFIANIINGIMNWAVKKAAQAVNYIMETDPTLNKLTREAEESSKELQEDLKKIREDQGDDHIPF